ncbi:PAS domain-containing sensor histidine kinase [Mucilaginibacter sp. CAU 1740]|uniref:PAS domain-containing sensor histidine kinase n=1 Tax=Mucilaginibacter sp. CAU 1740 TaxID=3140365 RepID=UPI00325B2B6F
MASRSAFTEQSLQLSNEHLAVALDQAALGFWEVSLSEDHEMNCTEQCKRNFGRDTELPFSYQEMLAAIVPEDQAPMQAAVARAIQEQVPYFAQYRVKHPDGSVRWIEAQGKVIYDAQVPVKIIGTTIDITRMKDLEILRDELLSVAMHELKTPLSAVKGSLQLLERHLQKQDDAKILGIATRALGSADRITRLLNEMAQPVLAQERDILLQKTAFDLLALIREITANAALLHPEHEIMIKADLETAPVIADRFRIGQVVTNLLNNAIKYSPGQLKIDITLNTSHSAVTVKFTDHGLGIAPQDRTKVFQKFFRSGERRAIDGLGIGLYLCSEIIVRHGGVIGIEDNPAPGTTVYFMLPA